MRVRAREVFARFLTAKPRVWAGLAAGALAVGLWLELPYVNWRRAAAPLDQRPLVIRQDAKGDGRFESPRSGRRKHRGIDLAAPKGSPVRTIRSGTILQVGRHRGLGRFVEVEHRGGLRSLYAHLDTVGVDVGSRVRQGQVIGTVGKTGNARHPWITPHVHLEVTKNGAPVNPELVGLKVVSPEPSTLSESTDERDDASGGE